MKGKTTIAGFFSYVRADDEFENRRISRLRERLERAIPFYSGLREFHIFQDWKDIGWGQQWEKEIAESIDNSIVLFPIVTPSYFFSEACRGEILAFDKRQGKLQRDDLILPIYYLPSEMMGDSDENPAPSEAVKVAEVLKRIQFEDWRALRKTAETDLAYGEAIERLAQRAIPALKRRVMASVESTTGGKNQTKEAGRIGAGPRRSAKSGGPGDRLAPPSRRELRTPRHQA